MPRAKMTEAQRNYDREYRREWKRKHRAVHGSEKDSANRPKPEDAGRHRESVIAWLSAHHYSLEGGFLPSDAVQLAKSAGLL